MKFFDLIFTNSAPLGRVGHRVAMSVEMSVCAIECSFFRGLSLALRSHDQIPASHWSTPPPPPLRWSGGGGGGLTNERPGSGHVTWGPMRGLEKNCTRWRRQTDTNTHRRTWRLYDQLGPVGRSWWKSWFTKLLFKNIKENYKAPWWAILLWLGCLGLLRNV